MGPAPAAERCSGSAVPNEARRGRTRVQFYRRLESLLAKLGMRRKAGETQREFAQSAAQRLAESADGQSAAAALPDQIVSAFYDVRFGHTPLSEQQSEEIDQKLEQLKKAVTTRPAGP